MQIKRLGFARECSNRSGDDFFADFFITYLVVSRLDLAMRCVRNDAKSSPLGALVRPRRLGHNPQGIVPRYPAS